MSYGDKVSQGDGPNCFLLAHWWGNAISPLHVSMSKVTWCFICLIWDESGFLSVIGQMQSVFGSASSCQTSMRKN